MNKKNQKPISIDAHLVYRCPKTNCGFDHYLSLKETQTKNFKIVCDCGFVFKPKRIKKLKIVYFEPININEPKQNDKTVNNTEIPIELKNESAKLLISYGFTKNESLELIYKAWLLNSSTIDSASLLVKYIVQNLGALNEHN